MGLRRRGFSEDQVREIEDIYRILYVQNSNVSKGIKVVEDTMANSPLREEIIGFIKNAENGVIRGMI